MQLALLYAITFLTLVGGALFVAVRTVAREQYRARQNPYQMRRGMRSVAGTAMFFSSLFLLVVAMLLNSPPLFYMSTAVIATLLASRLQAWLAVRGLHFERVTPEKATVGELVTVEMRVWSDRRIRRPLVTVVDLIPARISAVDRTPSLPIAPAYDIPIRTQYRFRPMRRGRFKWSSVQVNGTDALGLVTMSRSYEVPAGEMLVVPAPMPLDIDLPAASGYGIAETEAGQGRGTGIEPRGVREYFTGDSIRYIHWPSSARSGRLMVKEFETGAYAMVSMLIQRSVGSDVGVGKNSTLERMCSHVAYLSERMLRQGAMVTLPQVEQNARRSNSPHERQQEILVSLAYFEADQQGSLGEEVMASADEIRAGSMAYILVSLADPNLAAAVRSLVVQGVRVNVLCYEPREFLPPKHGFHGKPSTDPEFVAGLEGAGAYVVKVPGAAK